MAPPSLNPQSMGNGQPQQSLPNMGSPFAQQNPSQSTNPFMGSHNSNNASNSPFAGAGTAGFKNPFSTEHNASGNPFGGGTAGGGIKGLIDSNNKLIQAITKLTTIFEKMTQKIGGGGGGFGTAGAGLGFGGGGAAAGIFGISDALQQQQLSRLANRSVISGGGLHQGQSLIQQNTQSQTSALVERLQRAYPNANTVGQLSNEVFKMQEQQYTAARAAGEDAVRPRGATSYDKAGIGPTLEQAHNVYRQVQENAMARGMNGEGFNRAMASSLSPAQYMDALDAHRQGQLMRQQQLNNIPIYGAMREYFGANLPAGVSNGVRMTHILSNMARTGYDAAKSGFNFASQVGATGTVSSMLSQIPLIGGALAVPYNALESRLNQFAPGESLARLVAQQGGIPQTGNYYNTHKALFKSYEMLGIDPNTALQEAVGFQEAAGRITGMDPTGSVLMGKSLARFSASGFTGQTIGAFTKFNRADKMLKFNPDTIFKYGLKLGLGDQGMMELQGAFEGIQNMVPSMGYRGNAQSIMGQIANNTRNGFIGAQGVLQAQRQIQTTAESGRGLKGIFSGLLETMTTAEMLIQAKGDPARAMEIFDTQFATEPSKLKKALGKRFGKATSKLGYLSAMTTADFRNIGQNKFEEGTLANFDANDIVFSKKMIEDQIDRGDDLYRNRKRQSNKLMDLNKQLEQQIIDGVSVKVLNDLAKPLGDLAKDMRTMAAGLSPLVKQVIKGVDLLVKISNAVDRLVGLIP